MYDPVQRKLKEMEEKNPSLNSHPQGFLNDLSDRVMLVLRNYVPYVNIIMQRATNIRANDRFHPPHASGLREVLLEMNSPDHLLTVGKTAQIPMSDNFPDFSKTKTPLYMDGKKIGDVFRVVGPGFENTVYEGRIPGYVNPSIAWANGHESDRSKIRPVDTVILQHTNGIRKDGHELRFVH